VRLERVEERVARGGGRECEGWRDQGQSRHRGVAVWEDRDWDRDRTSLLLLLVWSCEETGEDGQFARDVGAVQVVCWVRFLMNERYGSGLGADDIQ
jgi:hypothetical protein